MKVKGRSIVILSCVILCLCLTGCSKEVSRIPFSKFDFGTSNEQITEELGEPINTDSTVLGTTYAYSSDYLNKDGLLRYTYDEEGNLAAISWYYESYDDGEGITKAYDTILGDLENRYDAADNIMESDTTNTALWRLDGNGHIAVVSRVVPNDLSQIMYSYYPEEVSQKQLIMNQ